MVGRRKFSKAFRNQVVAEFLAGEATQVQLARRYGLLGQLIIELRKRSQKGS